MTDEEAYRVLGAAASEGPKAVQAAYRARAMEFHPDRAQGESERAYFAKKFLRVRDAYEQLRRSGFPVPAAQEIVPEPPSLRTYERRFAKAWDEEEFSTAEKLGLRAEWSLESVMLWGIVIPAGAIGTVLFLRYWLSASGAG